MGREYLFVYGTLKRGCGLHDVLREGGAVFVGDAVVEGYTIIISNGLPYAIRSRGCKIYGELYAVPSKLFKVLDVIESGYDRKAVLARLYGDYRRYWAYMYAYRSGASLTHCHFEEFPCLS